MGEDRAMLYLIASNTGLRAGELTRLTPSSFDLQGSPPIVTVEAAYSKHRREDILPLRPDLAALIGDYLAGKPKDAPIWPGSWVDRAGEMVCHDLEEAGIISRGESGRAFDFHALRRQFISNL